MRREEGNVERKQFTFYASFFQAISKIKKKADRAEAYDALCAYALYGTEPDLGQMSDSAAVVFMLAKPNLDSSRRKATNGKRGGESKQEEEEGQPEANGKQEEPASKPQANGRQTESKKEKEKEKEKEYECNNIPPKSSPQGDAPPEKHKHGQYGWVRLTAEEYARLIADLGEEEAARCIRYVDESAQANGNKNRWKDWNLVLRKCHAQGWGLSRKPDKAIQNSSVNLGALEAAMNRIYEGGAG